MHTQGEHWRRRYWRRNWKRWGRPPGTNPRKSWRGWTASNAASILYAASPLATKGKGRGGTLPTRWTTFCKVNPKL